jgi:toxin YhaV
MIVRHGWRLLGHSLFLDQLERLAVLADRARRADPEGWRSNANVRLLGALREVFLERIPSDPLGPQFRQGNTLGASHRHWLRAKFGGNRFRLFFRADSGARVIVYAWVNDRDTLRKAGSSSDPYAVFGRMLVQGNPPNEWLDLWAEAQSVTERFNVLSDKEGSASF